MNNYAKKVSHTLIFGLAILAIALLVYLVDKAGFRSYITPVLVVSACIYGIYLTANNKHLNK